MQSVLPSAVGLLLAIAPMLRAQDQSAVDPGLSQEIRKIVREELHRALSQLHGEDGGRAGGPGAAGPATTGESEGKETARRVHVLWSDREGGFTSQADEEGEPVEVHVRSKTQDAKPGADAARVRIWTTDGEPKAVRRGSPEHHAEGHGPVRVEVHPKHDPEGDTDVGVLIEKLRAKLRALEPRLRALESRGAGALTLELNDVTKELEGQRRTLPEARTGSVEVPVRAAIEMQGGEWRVRRVDATTPKQVKARIVRAVELAAPATAVEVAHPQAGSKSECCTDCCGDDACCADEAKPAPKSEAVIVAPKAKIMI